MWLDVHVHKLKAMDYVCFLNGKKLEKCFAANEEEGWADIYELDEIGKYIVEKEKPTGFSAVGFNINPLTSKLKTIRQFGKVELRRKNENDIV